MGVTTQTARPQFANAQTFSVFNVTMPGTAGTEVTHTFQNNTKKFTLRSRDEEATLSIADATGETGTKYFTLPGFTSWSEDGLALQSLTIYFASDKINHEVEIIEWT